MQIEAVEMRSKALESNNNGLNELNKELQERVARFEKQRQDAKNLGSAEEGKVRDCMCVCYALRSSDEIQQIWLTVRGPCQCVYIYTSLPVP